jgi:hypothetical protein
MSELKVNTLESNNTLTANSLTVGNVVVINSTGITAPGYTINISSIAIGNSSANITLVANASIASINIGGTTYTSLPYETVNTQIFTKSGTWTKPSWATDGEELVIVHMWGGGGGGSTNATAGYAGAGGAFVFGNFIASQCNTVCNVVIGIGGSATVNGTPGGISIFYANTTNSLNAYGGEGGNQTVTGGGNGGGWFANTGPLVGTRGTTGTDSTFGGGGGSVGSPYNSGNSIYGGGGGGAAGTGIAGSSIYGGGGGGGATGGTSIFGGAGGRGAAGSIPGGGGDAAQAGARGEVRVYTLRITM